MKPGRLEHVGADPLAERLRDLRAGRDAPDWADRLLALGCELTLATRGAVIGGEPARILAPAAMDDAPGEWFAAARRAAMARGVWAGPQGAHFVFAVPVGHAGTLDAPQAPAALVLEIATALKMDLALTRERMVGLAALAEAVTREARNGRAAGGALAAATAEAFMRAPDRSRGLFDAATTLAKGLAGVERLALVRLARGRATAVAMADHAAVDLAADLPRAVIALVEEQLDRPDAAEDALSPARQAYAARFGARPLLVRLAPGRRLGLVASLSDAEALQEAEPGPALALLECALDPRPPRRDAATRRRYLGHAAAAVAVLTVLAVLPRADVVEAPATFQPEWQQVVSAAFDGVVASTTIQPGDTVEAGTTVLARLETRELELEITAARARAANALRDATIARAGNKPAQEQIALLSARRAEAQLGLLEHRVAAAALRSPVSGVVVSGDLRRSLGQPVLRGQTLFEVAPQDSTRAEIRVLDEDIPRVAPGQTVRLLPSAEPDHARHAVVERVRPAAEVVQARNTFLVVARLAPAATPMRPGSEGVARIEVGRTTWLWSILRPPVRYVRRLLWI